MADTPTPWSLVTDGSSLDPGYAESIGYRHGSIVIVPGVMIYVMKVASMAGTLTPRSLVKDGLS